MKTPNILLAVALGSALISTSAQAEVKWLNGSPRAEKVTAANARRTATTQTVVKREKWSATRAIIFDQATKTLRKPTAAETASMVEHIEKMTSKPVRAIAGRIQANGTRQGSIEGEQANVVVARATADGQYETLCVQTFEEAAEFLGLVRVVTGGNQQ
ncbi:MAG: hypothetical protein QOJ98_1249 [Acidobacteriota bacterium]|jgi:hypothetical protein|nr:hypothetical protein [Acidobacteriota bacterium]